MDDSIRKAAVFLLSLDKSLAAEVLSQLPKDQVEAVTMQIAKLGDVESDEQSAVLDEFAELSGTQTCIERGGMDFASIRLRRRERSRRLAGRRAHAVLACTSRLG